ncbi:hypothetical protein HYR69_03380 [Candidatus Sumerlaeota bacterium]|nr:hypothetical protein [Candidatus Sumerlaeota bacterium]
MGPIRFYSRALGVLLLAGSASCGAAERKESASPKTAAKAAPVPLPRPEKLSGAEERILAADLDRLNTFTQLMEEMAGEMANLQKTVKVHQNEYFSNEEHDAIEHLLFRYLVCRESLWDMIEFYRDYDTRFVSERNRAKAFVTGYTAALHLYFFSSRMVATFLDEPMVIKKLNEAYYRSQIPEGTYNMVFNAVTDPKNLKDIAAAWEIYSGEFNRADSSLTKLLREDAEYKKLILNIQWTHEQTEKQKEDILNRTSVVSPAIRNSLRHSEITQFAETELKAAGSAMSAIRALTFTKVSRIKEPGVRPLEFAPDQVEEMKRELQPGDIILTYSAGYMSNVFLPGVFKHGITYVGSPEQRKQAGLTAPPADLSEPLKKRFMEAVERNLTPEGQPADLIEAVAEGVVFNSLEHLTECKINRLVALRPEISPEERTQSLSQLFAFLGDRYDFNFDFNDASAQCCTELIYRCFNNRGPIQFQLVKRMGRQTLSADDICETCVRSPKNPCLKPVLLTVADRRASSRAAILSGDEAASALKELMNSARE